MLVYAQWVEAPDHARYRAWLDKVVTGNEAYAVSELVLSSVVRILTHPGIFKPSLPLEAALAFVESIVRPAACVRVSPGARHWDIFVQLCRDAGATGNLVADAYLAALAIESGCEFMTVDRDFARFPGLRWRHPLES